MTKVKQLPNYRLAGVAFLDKALQIFSEVQGDFNQALNEVSQLSLPDVNVPVWTDPEIQKLDEALEEWHDDLEGIAKTLPKKTTADLVNYVYTFRPELYVLFLSRWSVEN